MYLSLFDFQVHGGTAVHHIRNAVERAEELAMNNWKTFEDKVYTVLFFDEVNTTAAVKIGRAHV